MPLLSPKIAPSSPPHDRAGASDYVWLAYSVFFFIEPVVRHNRPYWLKNLLIYAVFLATYIVCVQTRIHRRKLLTLAVMAAIGLFAFPLNSGSACFLSFSAAILPFTIESSLLVVLFTTSAALATVAEGHLLHLFWADYTFSVFMMVVVATSNIFIAQKKRATSRLLRAQDQIERLAALAERERIARDMHDVLGHTLSVIVLKSELAGRLLARIPTPDPTTTAALSTAAAISEIADVESTARKALAEVREAITGYRTEGLPAELDLARRTLLTAGITLTAQLPPKLDLSAAHETVLSLAMREAVTNVIRHARATHCDIQLAATSTGEHTLTLTDNGTTHTTPREGNGLRGMRERAEALGGNLLLTPTPTGTTLRLTLPAASPSTTIIPTEALDPHSVIPTEAQRSGGTCFSTPTPEPLPQ